MKKIDPAAYKNMTPEQREERKAAFEERKKLIESGWTEEEIDANERALKALYLLKKDQEKGNILSEIERNTLCAIVVERSSKSFFFFARYVLEMDLLTNISHKRWCDDLQKNVFAGKKRFMRLKPRGAFKSSIYGIGFTLWLWACISPQLRIFYTSANALLLSEISDKLNQYVGSAKTETLYSSIFGITRDSTSKNTTEIFNLHGRSGKGFSLILRPAGSSTVGIHPNVIICDDVCDQNDRESEATRQMKERWFDTLTPLLVPFKDDRTNILFQSVFYIGTVWHMKDLTNHIQEQNKKMPENLKWDIEIESICDDDGNTNYPDFISNEYIAYLRATISEIFFSCQYRNQALSEGLQVFNPDKMFYIRPDQIEPLLTQGEMLCVFDPSMGKAHSDYAAVWWLHKLGDKITVLDAIDDKVEFSLLVHQIAARNEKWNCRKMIYEDNGIILVKEALEKAHNRIGWNIYIDSVHHSSNKEERIISMQPDLYSGHVQFMSDYKTRYPEAFSQLIYFGVWNKDDFPDALEMGIEHFRQPTFKFIRYEQCL